MNTRKPQDEEINGQIYENRIKLSILDVIVSGFSVGIGIGLVIVLVYFSFIA